MATRFKVLAADKLAPEGLEYLAGQDDVEVVNKPGLSEDELAVIAGEHDAMIVRSGVKVTAKVIENAGRLKVIARAGVGVDNIDLEAATSKGILVVNTAEASTITTAEHAFALMMGLMRSIGPAHKSMTEGKWDRSKFKGRQLAGKSLGVIGFGRIGQAVAERALAFGMTVIAFDPFVNAATVMDGQVRMFQDFGELLPLADVLTFHVPMNDQTRGMLGTSTFGKCRKGVLVVNAARGGVVDEEALIEALESGQCGGAALDVYSSEPPPEDSPLRKHPKVLVTPHLGASTVEAQTAVSVDAARAALAYLRGEGISGAVNAGGLRLDLDPVQQRFVALADCMSRLIGPMIERGVAEVTIELAGAELVAAAGTLERFCLIGLLSGHLETPLNVVNVRHAAEQRGIRLRTVTSEGEDQHGPQMAISVTGGGQTRRIVGRVYNDMQPRVVEINGYHMDIIPSGPIVIVQNEDRPGMVGLVGTEFGQAQVNIADMAISRRDATALMVLKVDNEPPETMLNRLRYRPGILKVAVVNLPRINGS